MENPKPPLPGVAALGNDKNTRLRAHKDQRETSIEALPVFASAPLETRFEGDQSQTDAES